MMNKNIINIKIKYLIFEKKTYLKKKQIYNNDIEIQLRHDLL